MSSEHDLNNLKYRQLQRLAKKHGVRANLAKAVMIKEIWRVMLRESLSGSLSDLNINKDSVENIEKEKDKFQQFVSTDEVFEQNEINENTLENPVKVKNVNEIPISGGKEVDNVIFYFDKYCCSALTQFSGWEHTNLFYRGICSKENWVKIFILNKHRQQTGRRVLDKTQSENLRIFLTPSVDI